MRSQSEGIKREPVSENAYFYRVFSISSRRRWLPSVRRISLVLNNFRERRNGARRRGQFPGPPSSIAVEPRSLHSGPRRAGDVGPRIIADVQHLMSFDAGHVQQLRENSRIGFGCARRARGDVAGEQIGETAALQIRVAVAE